MSPAVRAGHSRVSPSMANLTVGMKDVNEGSQIRNQRCVSCYDFLLFFFKFSIYFFLGLLQLVNVTVSVCDIVVQIIVIMILAGVCICVHGAAECRLSCDKRLTLFWIPLPTVKCSAHRDTESVAGRRIIATIMTHVCN